MNVHKLRDISKLPYNTAVTVGMFDGVHIGHRHILMMLERQAVERGLHPVVVTFDCHPRQVLKADRAASFRVNTNEERYRLLEGCGVQEVVEVHFTAETAQLSACEFFEQVLCQKLQCKGTHGLLLFRSGRKGLEYHDAPLLYHHFPCLYRNRFFQKALICGHHDLPFLVLWRFRRMESVIHPVHVVDHKKVIIPAAL